MTNNIFEKMTNKERNAYNYVYKRTFVFEQGITKASSKHNSATKLLKQYAGKVPTWVRLALQKYEGCNVIRSDDQSYLSFYIAFGSKMSTRNTITFTTTDYVYNH